MTNPCLAITLGDPAGISYEIVCRAVSSLTVKRICSPIVFGDKQVLNNISPKYFKGMLLPFKFVECSNLGNSVKIGTPRQKRQA
ncbi:MAG: hypothetical protein LBQ13_03425 [Endomicrobium sp.]|jgi:4-hydroxythreonine-4-phosphate dehydrogenase|nr:hypothetical protein [Endomicrobium sp.]